MQSVGDNETWLHIKLHIGHLESSENLSDMNRIQTVCNQLSQAHCGNSRMSCAHRRRPTKIDCTVVAVLAAFEN